MKTTRLILATLLLAGLTLAGAGCISFEYDFDIDSDYEYEFQDEDLESYVEFRMDNQGMDYSSNGLDVNDEEYSGGRIEIGSLLHYYLTDVEGLTEVDGMYYPYMNVLIIDSNENVIHSADDLGSLSEVGIDIEDVEYLWTEMTLNEEVIESGETYTWYFVINDSLNEDNYIASVIEFEVE